MSRATWVVLLLVFGVVAVAVPFVGYSLPQCFGDATGHVSADCMSRWITAMPVFPDRLVYELGVPMSSVATFLVLVAGALCVHRLRRRTQRLRRSAS